MTPTGLPWADPGAMLLKKSVYLGVGNTGSKMCLYMKKDDLISKYILCVIRAAKAMQTDMPRGLDVAMLRPPCCSQSIT